MSAYAFRDVADPKLKEALTVFQELEIPYEQKVSRLENADAAAARFREPIYLNALRVILEKTVMGEVDPHHSTQVEVAISRAITAAVMTGSQELLPSLKKIAWHKDREVRNEIGSPHSYVDSRYYPKEVLLETVRAAEAYLPKTLDGKMPFQAALAEFDERVELFCTFVPVAERGVIQEYLDRVLTRYNDQEVRNYLEPRFKREMSRPSPPISTRSTEGNPESGIAPKKLKLPTTAMGTPPIEADRSGVSWWLVIAFATLGTTAFLIWRRMVRKQ